MVNIVEPEVTLIAHTRLNRPFEEEYEPAFSAFEQWLHEQNDTPDAETLTEFAGRACDQSFDRPNPATATTEDYLNRTLFEQAHWSIAEHASATFYITGVSRAFTHELIRHRHLSCSQLSQRFVDESEVSVVIPPALEDTTDEITYHEGEFDFAGPPAEALDWWGQEAAWIYEKLVNLLIDKGVSRKQAREAARAVLPNMTETKIVVTGNLRAWHEAVECRTAPDADAEMQEVMSMVQSQLHDIAPTIFPSE